MITPRIVTIRGRRVLARYLAHAPLLVLVVAAGVAIDASIALPLLVGIQGVVFLFTYTTTESTLRRNKHHLTEKFLTPNKHMYLGAVLAVYRYYDDENLPPRVESDRLASYYASIIRHLATIADEFGDPTKRADALEAVWELQACWSGEIAAEISRVEAEHARAERVRLWLLGPREDTEPSTPIEEWQAGS